MKHVVEYKLHAGETPYFISDGGYFAHNGRLIGLTHDDVGCFVPSATELITFATLNDFEDYVAELTISKLGGDALTEQQKRDLATTWWNSRH